MKSLHPGYIWMPVVESHLKAWIPNLEAPQAAAGAVHPWAYMGEPDHIAGCEACLARNEPKFVAGAECVVGGFSAP